MRGQVDWTKLGASFAKKTGKLLQETQHTISFLPAGSKSPKVISKRDLLKRPACCTARHADGGEEHARTASTDRPSSSNQPGPSSTFTSLAQPGQSSAPSHLATPSQLALSKPDSTPPALTSVTVTNPEQDKPAAGSSSDSSIIVLRTIPPQIETSPTITATPQRDAQGNQPKTSAKLTELKAQTKRRKQQWRRNKKKQLSSSPHPRTEANPKFLQPTLKLKREVERCDFAGIFDTDDE